MTYEEFCATYPTFFKFWEKEAVPLLMADGRMALYVGVWHFYLPEKYRTICTRLYSDSGCHPRDIAEMMFNGWRAQLELMPKITDDLTNFMLTHNTSFVDPERMDFAYGVLNKVKRVCSYSYKRSEVNPTPEPRIKSRGTAITALWNNL